LVFLAPIGYLNVPRAMGKSLMRDPERAPLVRRAFEVYATGRFTKQQLLKQSRAWGLICRRGRPLTSQAIGVLLRNQLYTGIGDVTEYGVRGKSGDCEPLIVEDLFCRVQPRCPVACRKGSARAPTVSANGVWQKRNPTLISGTARTRPLSSRRQTRRRHRSATVAHLPCGGNGQHYVPRAGRANHW
jgi:hypothetical protein